MLDFDKLILDVSFYILPTLRVNNELFSTTEQILRECMFEVSLRATEDKPTKREGWVRADGVCDHLNELALSSFAFALVQAIQYNDDWVSRVLAVKGRKWARQ
jgi:hypothetical protein